MKTNNQKHPLAAADSARRTGNARQSEAIHHFLGPCLVLAGPGSGKTFVITQRVYTLIREHHISPDKILVLTFSNAAAGEMRQRFLRLISERSSARTGRFSETMSQADETDAYNVHFGTFHSVFYHILQSLTGRRDPLLDPSARRELIENLLSRHPALNKENMDLRDLEQQITVLRSGHLSDSAAYAVPGLSDIDKEIRDLAREYEEYLKQTHRIDYDDMILQTLRILKEEPEKAAWWREQFSFLLIDEFQDISRPQYELVRILSNGNLFAVGDDDQSIYGFRGASPGLMRDFLRDYPDTRKIALNINYRCSPSILAASAKVISENKNRFSKKVLPAKKILEDPGFRDRVRVLAFEEDGMQYRHIAEEIRKSVAVSSDRPDDFAIIVRTQKQVQQAARILHEAKIPCRARVPEDHSLELEILGDLCAYFRLAADPAVTGLLSDLRAHRAVSFRTFHSEKRINGVPEDLMRILNRPERFVLYSDLYRAGGIIPTSRLASLFRDLDRIKRLNPQHALMYLRSGMRYEAFLLEQHLQEQDKVRAILDLAAEKAKTSSGISDFLKNLDSLQNALKDRDKAAASQSGRKNTGKDAGIPTQGVHILTMHAAKGLEFSSVYIPGLNEGRMPVRSSCTSPEGIEEERRLLYVAMTRARRHLTLLYTCGTRTSPAKPSRFLKVLGVHDWDYMVK